MSLAEESGLHSEPFPEVFSKPAEEPEIKEKVVVAAIA